MVGVAERISSDDPELVGNCSIIVIMKCSLVARKGPGEFSYVECL